MATWTLEQARQHLQAWLNADLALATMKEYRTAGGRTLTRANAAEITERIRFWRQEVKRLQGGRSSRFRRVIPYD